MNQTIDEISSWEIENVYENLFPMNEQTTRLI